MAKRSLGKLCGLMGVLFWVGLLGASRAAGDVLLNIDLSSTAVGSPIPTGPSGTPVTQYGAFGGFDSPLGTGVVSNVAGIGKAADLTTYHTNDQVGALYLDTGFGFNAEHIWLSFDINILNQAASGYGQVMNAGASPLLFGVRLYSPSGGDWASTFNVSPTGATTGDFGFRNVNNTVFQSFGSYTVGTANHIDIDVNYGTGTADAYVNGALAWSGYPLRGGAQAAASTSELFMYLNGSAGTANEVAIGNVEIQSVPLPRSVLMGLGLLVVVGVHRWWTAKRVGLR